MNTRDKILMVSLKHFIITGFDHTSLNLIAEEVGIKKPSIYYHFNSKEELLIKGIELVIETIEKELDTLHTIAGGTKNQLISLFECILDFNAKLSVMIGNDYGTPVNLISIFQMSANRFDTVSEIIDAYYARLSKRVEHIIEEGQKRGEVKAFLVKEVAAIEIIARIEGLLALASVCKSVDINSIRAQLYETLWSSIEAEQKLPKKNRLFGYKNIDLGHKW